MENIIDSVYIRHISKISGKRVCVFIDSEENANKITNKVIQVNQYALKIRPLMGKNKRVVISNVNPIIINPSILQALKEKGIKPVSSITEIRASLSNPNHTHIVSFRHQVYIKEDDDVPDSLTILTKNTHYRIYHNRWNKTRNNLFVWSHYKVTWKIRNRINILNFKKFQTSRRHFELENKEKQNI